MASWRGVCHRLQRQTWEHCVRNQSVASLHHGNATVMAGKVTLSGSVMKVASMRRLQMAVQAVAYLVIMRSQVVTAQETSYAKG